MKKILEFEVPNDQNEFDMANFGPAYHSVLWDLSQFLRNKMKYGHNYETADQALEDIQKELYTLMNDEKCHFMD